MIGKTSDWKEEFSASPMRWPHHPNVRKRPRAPSKGRRAFYANPGRLYDSAVCLQTAVRPLKRPSPRVAAAEITSKSP